MEHLEFAQMLMNVAFSGLLPARRGASCKRLRVNWTAVPKDRLILGIHRSSILPVSRSSGIRRSLASSAR